MISWPSSSISPSFFAGFFIKGYGAQGYLNDDIITICTRFQVFIAALPVAGNHIFVIAQMQQSPQLGIAPEDDVPTPAAIAPIGPCFGVEFGTGKMPAASTSVPAFAEHPYVINEIRFLHIRRKGRGNRRFGRGSFHI
jgi:hypothetical protein